MNALHVPIQDPRAASVVAELSRLVRDRGGVAHLVGGCVRDAVLNRPIADIDIEVFGIAVDELTSLLGSVAGFSLVGASFGVFKVHGLPIDVSVPRRERKTGLGHSAFAIDADPHMDPAHAAARRDFTINAIAWNPLTAEVVDPFGGMSDLEARVLRHTSGQFSEDPLRVLRGMQFIARFELTPAPETVALCRSIEPEGLAAERRFDEWRKLLLAGRRIGDGLRFLEATGWLQHTPELDALRGCPQDPIWHPEGDVWVHTCHVMDCFAEERLGDEWEDLVVGFACLCHDLGKPSTTAWIDGRWRSPGHEHSGLAPTGDLLGGLTNQHRLASQVLPLVADHLKPDQLFDQGAGAAAVRRLARRVGRLDRLVRVARADRFGRPPSPRDDFPAARWLLDVANQADVADQPPQPLVLGRHLIDLGLQPGPAFGPLLDACFEAQLDGQIATVAEGLDLVRSRLGEHAGPIPSP
ncbi:MAG: CCA tRNA nucleotidyltransferase [Acidimicrobiales bacterium]